MVKMVGFEPTRLPTSKLISGEPETSAITTRPHLLGIWGGGMVYSAREVEVEVSCGLGWEVGGVWGNVVKRSGTPSGRWHVVNR